MHKNKSPNGKLIVFACLMIAFFFSYSFAVHFLNWYTESVLIKAILLIGMTGVVGKFLLMVRDKLFFKNYEVPHKFFQHIFIFSFVSLVLLSVYFISYYEPVPFLTTHQLKVVNIDEDTGGERWNPVEITDITFLDGTPIALSDLEFTGDHWISEGKILLKPASAIQFNRMFIGAVKISFRSDPDQGMVSVMWDGQERFIDLAAGDESHVTVSLLSTSWGSPKLAWCGMAVLSIISDFFTIFLVILIMAAFFLMNYLSVKENGAKSDSALKFTWIDFSIIVFLLGISLILSKNLFGGHFMEYAQLSGDAGNYASFAAAKTYPELFQNDPLLNDVNNFDVYSTYHVYLTKVLAPIFGNFGTAFMVLQLPLTFMQLCGFYLLGRELYKSRLFGSFLSAFAFIFVRMNLSEFWGYETSPIPRFSFQACLPFVLLMVLKQGDQRKRWPLILAITAALTYVHAVSAPAWSIAIALSLWFMTPHSIPAKEKSKYMLYAILIFIIILLPFSVQYFKTTLSGEQDISVINEVRDIIDFRLPEGQIDFQTAIRDFVNNVLFTDILHTSLFLVSMISFLGMNYISRDSTEGQRVIAVSMWVVGIVIGSILFPMIDFTIANTLGKNPLQIQFLRSLRNFFPLLYIYFLWPFAHIYRNTQGKNSFFKVNKFAPTIFCICFIALWSKFNGFTKTPVISNTIACWKEGKVICSENKELGIRAEFFTSVREETPINARILSDDLAVRYYSLRPLAFSKKDGGTFSFANQAALIEWYEYAQVYDDLWVLRDDPEAYINAYTNFAQLVRADYLVLEEPYSNQDSYPTELELVFSNEGYSLFKVQDIAN